MPLKVGDKAPRFTGKNLADEEVSLDQYAGRRNVFLVFYVKAFSSVCAVQLPTYNRNLDGFRSRETEVIAVSVDNSFSQKAFCDSIGGIDYPVISDMGLTIAKQYDVALPSGFATRAEFLIDKEGVIRWLNIESNPAENTPTIDEIFTAIEAV